MTPTSRKLPQPPPNSLRRAPVLVVASLVVLTLAGCSSLPKQPVQVDTTKNQAAQYTQAGNTYFDQGNYSQAQKFFNMALEANMSVYSEAGMASSYNSLGKVYLAVGRLDDAETDFRNANDIAARVGDAALLIDTSNNLGELLLSRGKPDEALAQFKGALAKVTDPRSLAAARLDHNVGSAYKELADYANALDFLNRALAIHVELKRIAEAASDYYMIASVYSKQANYPEALRNAKLALANDQKMENSPGIASDLQAIGIISEKSGDLAGAETSYLGALQVYETIGVVDEVKSLLTKLQSIATARGNAADARAYASALATLEASK